MPDLGRSDGQLARKVEPVGADHLESEAFGDGLDLVRRTSVMADAVVVAQQEGLGTQTTNQEVPEILFRRHPAECPGERNDFHAVDPDFLEQRLLLFEGRQEPQVPRPVLEHGPGMGPESDHRGGGVPLLRGGHELSQDKTVPKMDTVEKSGCYNHLTSPKSCLCGSCGFLA